MASEAGVFFLTFFTIIFLLVHFAVAILTSKAILGELSLSIKLTYVFIFLSWTIPFIGSAISRKKCLHTGSQDILQPRSKNQYSLFDTGGFGGSDSFGGDGGCGDGGGGE